MYRNRISLIAAVATCLVASSVRADSPGVDLPWGQYYAIDGCQQVSGTCEMTTVGSLGSVNIKAAAGESICHWIDDEPTFCQEKAGNNAEFGITTFWGRLEVQGAIFTQRARRVSEDTELDFSDVTLLVDSSVSDVTVYLTPARYNPGRRVTIKKTVSAHVVYIVPEWGTLDGVVAGTSITTVNDVVTVEAVPDGDPVSGPLTDEWAIVGH